MAINIKARDALARDIERLHRVASSLSTTLADIAATDSGVEEGGVLRYHAAQARRDMQDVLLNLESAKTNVKNIPLAEDAEVSVKLYQWKELSTGRIVQEEPAPSKEALFERYGFGAVRVDEPIKGCIAVEVQRGDGGRLFEVEGGQS